MAFDHTIWPRYTVQCTSGSGLWAEQNNMQFNSMKFNFLSFSHRCPSSNEYLTQDSHIVKQDHNVKPGSRYFLCLMTFLFLFTLVTRHAIRIDQRLSGSILRSFISRDSYLMLTFKCVVLSHIEYGRQLWCRYLKRDILLLALESVQCSFTIKAYFWHVIFWL